MSVLKNKRKEAKSQHVESFEQLYDYMSTTLMSIPKRKHEFLAVPIMNKLNIIYEKIHSLNNDYFQFGIKIKDVPDRAKEVMKDICSIECDLLRLWNIENRRYTTNKMIHCITLFNDMLHKMINYGNLNMQKGAIMFVLDKNAIQNVEFIGTMSKLHRELYRIIISTPAYFRETRGGLLLKLADEALYEVCMTNRRIPKTKKQADKRAEHLAASMDTLNKMQVSMISLFNIANIDDKCKKHLSYLLTKEIKLLNGLKKSDEKLYGDLT